MTFPLWQKAILVCFLSCIQSAGAETSYWSKEYYFAPSSSSIRHQVWLGRSNVFVRGPYEGIPNTTGLAVLDLSGKVLAKKELYSPSFSISEGPQDLLLFQISDSSNLYLFAYSPPWTTNFGIRVTDPILTGSISSARSFIAGDQAVFAFSGTDKRARLGMFDLNGNSLWARRINNVETSTVRIRSSDSESVFLLMNNDSATPATRHFAKFSSTGSLVWSRQSTGPSTFPIGSLSPTRDGGLLGLDGSKLARVGSDGSLLWSKVIPGWSAAEFVELPSGDLVLLMSNHDPAGPAGLLHLNSSGELMAARGFPFKTGDQMNIDYGGNDKQVRIYINAPLLGQSTASVGWAMAIYNPETMEASWYHWPRLRSTTDRFVNFLAHHDAQDLLLGYFQTSASVTIFTVDSRTGFGCHSMQRLDVEFPVIQIVPEDRPLGWTASLMNTEPFSGFETAKNYVEEGFLWVTALCEEEFHEPKFDASIQSGEVLLKHQRPTQARTIIEESTNLKDWNPVQTNMPAQLPLKVNTSGTGERLFFRSVSTLP